MGIETAIVGAGMLGLGGTLIGGGMQARAMGKASSAQAEGTAYAADVQHQMQREAIQATMDQYYQGLKFQEPYRMAGAQALETLQRELYGDSYKPTWQYEPLPITEADIPYETHEERLAHGGDPRYGRWAPLGDSGAKQWVEYGKSYSTPTGPKIARPMAGDLGAGGYTGLTGGREYQGPPSISLETSPLYQLQLSEGTKAIKQQMAAIGGLRSGSGMGHISDYTRKLIAGESMRKQALAEMLSGYGGQASAAGLNASLATGQGLQSAYMQGGANLSNLYMNAANNRANMFMAGGQNQANTWTNFANLGMAGANAYALYRGLQSHYGGGN